MLLAVFEGTMPVTRNNMRRWITVISLLTWLVSSQVSGKYDFENIDSVLEELEDRESSVMVAVIINNHLGHILTLEELDIHCGIISVNSTLPDTINPKESHLIFTEKVKQSINQSLLNLRS